MKRVRSYLYRTHSRWFHSHHCNCHHCMNHSRTLHSVRRRTHRYQCQHTWIGWPWPFCVPGESSRRRREVRPALLSGFALRRSDVAGGKGLQVENITIDALVLSLFVDVVKAAEHFDSGEMRASIIDDALGPMFYEVLEKLQGL